MGDRTYYVPPSGDSQWEKPMETAEYSVEALPIADGLLLGVRDAKRIMLISHAEKLREIMDKHFPKPVESSEPSSEDENRDDRYRPERRRLIARFQRASIQCQMS